MTAEISIQTETDTERGWMFEVHVFNNGKVHKYDVTLGWADYDLWSHGQIAPQRVIHAAFEFLLQQEPAESIMQHFDCAIIRRHFPEVDKKLPAMLSK